ncbi:amp dependent CoA ligase [Wolfiporia cocos MD-104 SS10]|uniref:Amp dependent CoA ligase n=1 Tax=Wolfiporia cocos (strain MD-104) TaxID=742152 RepID=A0A2H3J3S7_WOLCO|nr:amp dependent CoA ligase [Wolfiporia cocos MD-104 SS10]
MTEIHAPGGPLPYIPDDVTVVQFMLDYTHESRPTAPAAQLNPCMIEDATGRRVTFAEVKARTTALANALSSRLGIKEDDVVCICSPNHVDYPVTVWATHRLGAVVTAANPAYTVGELEHQLTTTCTKLLIVHPWNYATASAAASNANIPHDHIILLDEVGEAVYPQQTVQRLVEDGLSCPPSFVERSLRPGEADKKLAFLSLSSGTTGRPKAVCIPHRAVVAGIIQLAHLANQQRMRWEERKLRAGDIWLAQMPFFHIYGLVVIMHFALFYSVTIVVVPKFHLTDMLASIQRHRINLLPVVPPMVVLLCKNPAISQFDLSSLRVVVCGAAPLSAELVRQLSSILPTVHIGQGYGMTEAVGSLAFLQMEQKIGTPGSAGRLLPGIIARVVRPDGSLAKLGQPGHLIVKGPCMALGYLNDEQATEETFVDGWLYTGDEVMVNEQAEVFILDRIKELLKVRGYQVAPAELEGHLLVHPDVADVCVVGVPDDYNGEVPLAFVVPQADALNRMKNDPAEADRVKAALVKHVADAKVQYKWLTGGVHFIDAIPKNPSGKLLRRTLRDRAKELQEQGPSVSIRAKL